MYNLTVGKRIILAIFILSLLVAIPSIIILITDNFNFAELFKTNPIKDGIKDITFKKFPEWKPLEQRLEQTIPNSSVNVSITTIVAQPTNSYELEISIVTDKTLTETQSDQVKNTVCTILGKETKKYSKITYTIGDFKFNSTNTSTEKIHCN